MLERVFSGHHGLVDTPGGDGGSLVGHSGQTWHGLPSSTIKTLFQGGINA